VLLSQAAIGRVAGNAGLLILRVCGLSDVRDGGCSRGRLTGCLDTVWGDPSRTPDAHDHLKAPKTRLRVALTPCSAPL
jgi:hypothetical protein